MAKQVSINFDVLETNGPTEIFKVGNKSIRAVRVKLGKSQNLNNSQVKVYLPSDKISTKFLLSNKGIKVSEASKKYGLSKRKLYDLCNKKLVKYEVINGIKYIDIPTLEAYIKGQN